MPKPVWLKVKIAAGSGFKNVRDALHANELHTVCEEAKCPNIAECWNSGTATFMVLGRVCTRNCLFCGVESARQGQQVESREPEKIAAAVKKFGLGYAVLTSVDRDDLPDFGADHFARCVRAVKASCARVEALIPDFQGSLGCLRKVIMAEPDVVGHNIEVVERLQAIARDARSSYRQSLAVLRNAKKLSGKIFTKSSVMLGLGEEKQEVLQAIDDLLAAGVDFLTIGQYLQPGKRNLPVVEFVKPEQFAQYRKIALRRGFRGVVAGPLVRSSYRAAELLAMRESHKTGELPEGRKSRGASALVERQGRCRAGELLEGQLGL